MNVVRVLPVARAGAVRSLGVLWRSADNWAFNPPFHPPHTSHTSHTSHSHIHPPSPTTHHSDPDLIHQATNKLLRTLPHRGISNTGVAQFAAHGRYWDAVKSGLVFDVGTTWKSTRSSVAPLFYNRSLSQFVPTLKASANKVAKVLLEQGVGGSEVDVARMMGRMTLQNTLSFLMG